MYCGWIYYCHYGQYFVWLYCEYTPSISFILPELRVFRYSIQQVLPVLAVIREDTASIGNILVMRTADGYIIAIMGSTFV